MTKSIFINLPVTNLPASVRFYEAVGFVKNPQFSNEQAASMMWSEEIVVMLLTQDFWKTFTSKVIPDAHQSAQVMLCLSHESRAAVDSIAARASAAGGRTDPTPAQDHGFMYGKSFEDPDGHIWENVWMDMSAVPESPAAAARSEEQHAD